MTTTFDDEVFYETYLQPHTILRTRDVRIRDVPGREVKAVTDEIDFREERFERQIAFYDLEPLTVAYRTYGPTAAGAVLWLQDVPVATLGLLDRGRDEGIHDFHRVLGNLAQRNNETQRVIARARLPTSRPALFVVSMDFPDLATHAGLYRFTHALMVAFLHHHQRAWHTRRKDAPV